MRFRFPDGIPGKVICEAHMGHYVGYDSDKGTWRTDISESDSGKLAEVSYFTDRDANKKYIQIGVGGYYISTNAQSKSPESSLSLGSKDSRISLSRDLTRCPMAVR